MLSTCVEMCIRSNPEYVCYQCDKRNCYMQDSKTLKNYGNVSFVIKFYFLIAIHLHANTDTGDQILVLF
jgi:hypothetical protein